MNWAVALRLGRVSNLPTIWTNVAAGVVLSGGTIAPLPFTLALTALSLFYLAGMYLNDAFDRDFDAVSYPQRPIPSGAVKATTVFAVGFLGLATGELLLVGLGYGLEDGQGWPPVVAGLCLAGSIVYYNLHHKNNPLGPLFMGLCRAQVYLTTALAIAPTLSVDIRYGTGVLAAYVIGLSYVARQETPARLASLWPLLFLTAPFIYGAAGALRGFVLALVYASFAAWVLYAVRRLTGNTQADIRAGVSMLIAGISWLDALLMALAGEMWLAAVAVGGALLTRLAQRIVPGT